MPQPETKYLKDYTPPPYLVDTIDLTVELFDDHAHVKSVMTVVRNRVVAASSVPFEMDGKELELLALYCDDKPVPDVSYEASESGLVIRDVPEAFTLTIETRIVPHTNTSLEGFYKAGASFLTQCEAEGFRRITYFPDRPDVMAVFTCTLIADKARFPVLLANGNPVKKGDLEDNRHFATWHDPYRKPSYLFAMVAGDFVCIEDTYTTGSGRKVGLQFYVEPENADKCDHAVRSLQKAMAWDEQVFGLEYDLDLYMVVATSEFNMGAMENKGLNVFNSKYVLARQETATDTDFQDIERVIAHEYFHNWTGNRVTVCNWFQLSLKEGLTVFRDQEFSSDMGSRAIKRISDVRVLRAAQFPEDAGPMAHPVRPESYIEMNNFYTVTVYNKGAEVIRMIHTILGRDNFRKGMDLYFERHDGKAVTIEDFVAAMEDASGVDLFSFRRWYAQAGTPQVTIDRAYDRTNKTYSLTFTQIVPDTPGQSEKLPMVIPVQLALLSREGKELPLTLVNAPDDSQGCTERVICLKTPSETLTFTQVDEEPVPSLFRGFSAPVVVHDGFTEDERMFLLGHETDSFNRWDAAQKLYTEHIFAMVEQLRLGRHLEPPDTLIMSVKKTLLHPELDQALISEILSIPSETELGNQMTAIAVDEIHEARSGFIRHLSETLEEEFRRIYDDLTDTGPYCIDASSMARRALKNKALYYLSKLPGAAAMVMDAFERATNMTDEIAALSCLSHMEGEAREKALQIFYRKWRHDTLVLDKWFAVQAGSQCADTLERVKQLMAHEAFTIKNPNKVRALVGVFCMNNPFHFHRLDGEGYRFLSDTVLALNTLNPSMAARMAAGFNKWKRYDDRRKTLMQKELARIKSQPSLAKGVFEIVTRALAH